MVSLRTDKRETHQKNGRKTRGFEFGRNDKVIKKENERVVGEGGANVNVRRIEYKNQARILD